MIALAGYTITAEIYADDKIVIYRGIHHNENDTNVIIKTLKTEYPTPKELAQFRHEYEITKELYLTGSVRPYQLQKYNNGLALVLEDIGGDSLKNIIANKKINASTFIKIALQLASAIGELHQHNIIHKDIKPANIIANLETERIKITDFSISTRLSLESQQVILPNKLEGTLAYVSPEQTGRMHRPVDYRTDFYSLGITFYEMLVGWLPFQSSDPMELIHSHIAKIPVAPHDLNPDIPKQISDIIMKLLAKNPDDRYQSAYGLKIDLQLCLNELTTQGQIKEFTLGQQDVADKFQLPQKIYGRSVELANLFAIFSKVSQGARIMVLLSGDVGMGKSALAQDLQKPVMRNHGFFIAGRFDSVQQNQPYSAIIQALRELILQLLTETATQIDTWRQKLLATLGGNAQVLIQVIPEMEMILGKQPPISELGAIETQNRFNMVFIRFIQVVAQPSHPLVIFLDDLQWADTASLKLIEAMITDQNISALLLIGGYRDIPDLSQGRLLLETLEALSQTSVTIEKITLEPLKLEYVKQLVADTLHCSLLHGQSLAELVRNKTDGNPFFIKEFLKTLYQEKCLRFNSNSKKWEWNVRQILEMDMTDNVVALMHTRLQKLSEATQELLKLAACIGIQFDIRTLAQLYQQSETITTEVLWEAVEENLVVPQSDTFQMLYEADLDVTITHTAEFDLVKTGYRFIHDRIQQTAYALLPDQQKQAVHYKLGRLLRENTDPGHLEEYLFDIVNHLNLGIALIKNQPESYDLARLNLAAGKRAKASTAYDVAHNYLKIGLSLLVSDSWQKQYHLTLAVHIQAMEIGYLTGAFRDADELFETVLHNANSLLDQVKAYEIKILFFISQNKMLIAVETGLKVLQLLNIHISADNDNFSASFDELQKLMQGRRIEELVDLPEMKDQHKLAALRILMHISNAAYVVAPHLYPLIGFTQTKICVQYGNSPFAAYSYAVYSILLCSKLGDTDAGYRLGQVALQLLERFDNKDYTAKVLTSVNTCTRHWKEPAKHLLTPLSNTIQSGLEIGDIEYACHAAIYYGVYSFLVGIDLETVSERYEYYLEFMFNSKQSYQIYSTQPWYQLALNLQGISKQLCRLEGDGCNEDTLLPILIEKNNISALFAVYFAKAYLCYLFKDPQQALEHANKAHLYVDGANPFLQYVVYRFYHSLILLANCIGVDEQTRTNYLNLVEINQSFMKQWAEYAPCNFQHKYDLVAAEQARILGNIPAALTAYEQAIKGAKKYSYIQEEALANELAAEFYLQLNIQKAAQTYLIDAHYAYLTWGANAKVKALEGNYPALTYRHHRNDMDLTLTQTTTATTVTSTTGTIQGNNFDLATVMKAAQAISGEIVLEQLLKKLLHIVIENVGAQECLLILEKQGQLFIEAEVHANQTEKVILQSTELEVIEKDGVNDTSKPLLAPVTLINYVARLQKYIVLSDASHEGMFINDPYVICHQPKSILCSPLINKGKLIGVLYLENNLITSAFTTDRLNVVKLLSTQVAISIENAFVYSELEQARQAAESANRAKSAFLMNMSHELRTPLNAILGYSDLIQESAVDMNYEEVLPDLEKIQIAGKQLLEIISNVLDISKIEADKMGLNLDVFDVTELVNNVVTIIQPSVGDNTLQVICAHNLSTMHADAVKVQQILLNLLSNAIKFTHHGKITFAVTRHSAALDGNALNFDWLHFEITDTGIGMPPEQIEHIFEAFNQVDNSTTRQYGGTGLGLTISDRFSRMMGGKILVSSEPGQGSIFTAQLPSQVTAVIDMRLTENS